MRKRFLTRCQGIEGEKKLHKRSRSCEIGPSKLLEDKEKIPPFFFPRHLPFLVLLRRLPLLIFLRAAMFQLFVNLPTGTTVLLTSSSPLGPSELGHRIASEFAIPIELQRLTTLGGRTLSGHSSPPGDGEDRTGAAEDSELTLEHGQTVACVLGLPGGKGGFGSMLRSQGAKMKAKSTTNFGSCRDLSGRRLKAIDDAKL